MFIFLLIILQSLLINWLFKKINIPGFIGVILVGIINSTYLTNNDTFLILNFSGYICGLALIIIFARASLQVELSLLCKSNIKIYLLGIIPGLLEAVSITFLSYWITPLSLIECFMLGFIMTAVSPAVIVPMMIDLQKRKIGTDKKIPSIILAASSLDDIISILIFSGLLFFYQASYIHSYSRLLNALFLLFIFIFFRYFRKFKASLVEKFSNLLSKIWSIAALLLFIFIGSQIDINIAILAGKSGLIIIIFGLIIRSLSILLCLTKSSFLLIEKFFIIFSLWPKATVQATLGAIPLLIMSNLDKDTTSGYWILSLSVLSILVTAPVGAFMISWSSKRWLKEN